jgi:class 3 adenylate cyclase
MIPLHYYLCMASIMLVDATITVSYALLSGRAEVLPVALAANLAILGGVNLVGARFLFKPVGDYLAGRGSPDRCRRRLLRLPRWSTLWAAAVALAYGLIVFSQGVFTPPGLEQAVRPMLLLGMFVWFLFVYCAYMCFVVFFAVTDLTARIRAELFQREGAVIAGRDGRLLPRLVAVFLLVTVLPVALVMADVLWFQEVRRLQGLGVEKVVVLDLLGALVAAGLSLVFVTRGLVRPIDWLMQGVRKVRRGDLDAYVPAITSDELGELAVSFNRMIDGLRERAFVRETFGRYVSPDVAEAILAAQADGGGGEARDGARLTGRVGEATVLFTDITGFSDLVSRMDPAAVMDLLNEYFTLIAEPIQAHGGVINNFIGDAVLATFNLPVPDPDHADKAVACALAIQDLLAGRRFAGGIRLDTRIGINTGRVVAGTLGPPDRLAYTVLGREVNLAARLERMNKETGTKVLVSAATCAACRDPAVAFRPIGRARVKGSAEPVEVFAADRSRPTRTARRA